MDGLRRNECRSCVLTAVCTAHFQVDWAVLKSQAVWRSLEELGGSSDHAHLRPVKTLPRLISTGHIVSPPTPTIELSPLTLCNQRCVHGLELSFSRPMVLSDSLSVRTGTVSTCPAPVTLMR